ncbi:MAG: MFS transporter [archaeon]|nr:MAG: MFS transporter [archaeon]
MVHHKHFFHFLIFRRFTEIKALYSVVFLKSFAMSLISIFIPVYLYLLGYGLGQIAVFFLIYSALATIFVFVAGHSVKKIGIKATILIANILNICGYLALAFLRYNPMFFYLAAVLLGAFLTLFWVPFHTDMADNLKRKKMAQGFGTLNIVSVLAAAVAPLIGSLIASVSFFTLFIISALIILISIVPLFFAKGTKEKATFNVKETFSHFTWRRFLGGIGFGGEHLTFYAYWPLFLFLIISIKGLGLVTTIMFITSGFFIYFISKVIDKKGPNKVMRPWIIVNTIAWPFRLIKFLAIPFHITYAFLEGLTKLPYNVKTYKVGKRGREINAIAFREICIQLGRVIACIPIIIFPTFVTAFIAAAGFSFIQVFYSYEK